MRLSLTVVLSLALACLGLVQAVHVARPFSVSLEGNDYSVLYA